MRPVTLTFEGLRSYRAKTVIDFTNLDLFAVIGDTGAGKSTIIEALSLALYGRKSWSGGANLVDMIADGMNTMRIEFAFTANGHDWVVTRARHRNASQPVDKLVSPSGGGPNVDQARAVTTRIEELLGLTHEQFTRAVVMPQGRFDELLRASERERTAILSSILGLDSISKTRDAVDAARVDWKAKAATYIERRRGYPADPRAELKMATKTAKDLENQATILSTAAQAADNHQRHAIAASQAVTTITAAIAAVPAPPAGTTADELAAITAIAATLTEQGRAASDTAAAALAELMTIDAKIANALAGYASRDELVARRTTLTQVAETLDADVNAYQDAIARVEQLQRAAPAAEPDQQLMELLEGARAAAADTGAALTSARQRLDDARQVWRALLAARRAVVEHAVTRATLSARCDELDQAATVAQGELDAAETLVEEADAAHHAALVADAAATAGADCQPGDPCPVCTRALDDNYVAPQAADHSQERGLRETANQALAARRGELTTATAAASRARGELDAATISHHTALAAFTAAAQAAADCALPPVPAPSDGELSDDIPGEIVAEAQALATFTIELETAVARHQQAEADLATAGERLAAARATLDARRVAFDTELAAARGQVTSSRARLASVHQILGTGCDGPDMFSVPDSGLAAELIGDCTGRLDELERLTGERAEIDQHQRLAEQASAEALTAYHRDVRDPAMRIVQGVNMRSGRARDVRAALAAAATTVDGLPGVVPVAAPGALDEIDDLAEALDQMVAAVLGINAATSDLLAAASTAVEHCTTAHEQAATALADALAAVGCADLTELHTTFGRIQADRDTALDQVAEAAAAVTVAEQLDRIVDVAAPFVANLEVLSVSLRDQHFIGHLVKAREAELLAEASRRLKSITNGRFGFVAGFGVVNVASGEVRSPDTLSGGERFQAALGLALALVEIASRGAGRLDAVFVDEGFGSLDANALDVALETLGKVAGAGKMVALISHLRPVAEYVDTVLHVTKDDVLGSQIAVLNSEDREQLLSDDVRSGLTV